MKKKEFRVRCWIDIDGVKFFGPGRAELLTLIQETGSISKAAKVMGMSYKKAWAMVEEMNSQGTCPYVITHKGGKKGGGTELTAAGKQIVAGYSKLMAKLSAVVRKEKALLNLI
jgi:molybdate transport system regulatory protein